MGISARAQGRAGYTEIVGIDQLHKVLDGLPKRYNRLLLVRASRKSAKNLLKTMRSLVSAKSKASGKQLGMWSIPAKHGLPGVYVGSEIDYWRITGKQSRIDALYKNVKSWGGRAAAMWAIKGLFWLDRGTSGIGRTGRFRGKRYRKVPELRWRDRSVDTNIRGIEKGFTKELAIETNKFLNKQIRKYGW